MSTKIFKIVLIVTLVSLSLSSNCARTIPGTLNDCLSLSNKSDACCMFTLSATNKLNATDLCESVNLNYAYLTPYVNTLVIKNKNTHLAVNTSINCGEGAHVTNECSNAPSKAKNINDCYKYGNSSGSCCYVGSDTSGICFFMHSLNATNTKKNGAVFQCSSSNTVNNMPAIQEVEIDEIDIAAGFNRYNILLAFIVAIVVLLF